MVHHLVIYLIQELKLIQHVKFPVQYVLKIKIIVKKILLLLLVILIWVHIVHQQADSSQSRYDLFGIINHRGSAWFGHYTSYARLLAIMIQLKLKLVKEF